MMMELDSQSMTPPSSPIIGYSGCDDEQSLIDSGVVYCLNCKGPPRPHDYSFSPEGYILRREVISAVENLRNEHYGNRGGDKAKLLKCFGHLFDPLDPKQIKNMILICRKNISSLEVLSESCHSFNGLQNYDVSSVSDDPDDLSNQNPWVLRRNVCQFLNVIVRGLKYYRTAWKAEDLCGMFSGLKKSLLPVKEWSSVLRTHCGFRSGNECSSATYHFFHLQLELRWSLFLIFGATPSITNWLLDELMQLAMHKYTAESGVPLDEKRPFNCMCIKEMWTMIRLIIEHKEPHTEKPFWSLYSEAVQRVPGSDPYFSIWLTSFLAQISDYSIAGVHRPGHGRVDSKENGNNAYQLIHGIFKEWVSRGGQSAEVLKLSFNFFQYWGGDCDTLVSLWTQWVPRLDGRNEVSNFESYSTIDNWLKLIAQICDSGAELCGNSDENNENISAEPRIGLSSRGTSSSSQSRHLGSNNDPFMEFVCLVAAYAKWAKEKDIRKLKSNICMKLTRSNCNTNDYGELGIIRVSSLFMALSTVTEFEREAVSMCERLQDIFTFGRGKNTPGRRKAILRAYSCMIIVLLKKKISLNSFPSVTTTYIKAIDELLCQVSSEPSRKDQVMVYIDLLDSLPKHTSTLCSRQDLGRHTLISSNLSMWFSNAGNNYVLRTAHSLSEITNWIVKWIVDPNLFIDPTSSSEGKDLFAKISDKSMPFMKSVVILNANRIPSTDMKPLACLAADITLLTRRFRRSTEECETLFDHFALHERTCPLVSEYFIERLCKTRDFIDNISPLKLTQTWIRLLVLGCPVPDELTEAVLQNGFSSTSNKELLREFCRKSNDFDKDTVQNYLTPLVSLLKGVMNATLFKDGVNAINSVIASCCIVLSSMRFELIYVKGMQNSVAHLLLNLIAPSDWQSTPPWEKFSSSVLSALEKNLFQVFEAVALYPGTTAHDPFLCRKLQDIVALGFFGFVKSPDSVNREHPALQIHDLTEAKAISLVQNQILPHVIAGDKVIEDLKLCQLFLSAVQMFRVKQLATAVMQLLAGVIRAFLKHVNSKERQTIMNSCINVVIYCCLVGSSGSPYKQLAVDGFKFAFEKEFNHRGRNAFQLCTAIAKSKNSTNGKLDAKRFLKSEIIPLLKIWVEKCELTRGIGFDRSLREPLQKLEFEMADVRV